MNWGNSLMSNIDDIKKAFEDQRDIVDALFEELGEKRKLYRIGGASLSWRSAAKKIIKDHLNEIGNETNIPKN